MAAVLTLHLDAQGDVALCVRGGGGILEQVDQNLLKRSRRVIFFSRICVLV